MSNVSLTHLEQMLEYHADAPAFVQNRCYARLGWDREIRELCRRNNIIYQGFSLLTANKDVLRHPAIMALAEQENAMPSQIVFAFSRAVGMLPLTGTSSSEHMRQDLESRDLVLAEDAVRAIESIAG
jgi:diketogulonate reductase-like aldo/keto reductase